MLVTASVTLYNNDTNDLKRLMDSFFKSKLDVHIFISDNSPTDALRSYFSHDKITYIYNGNNKGYGYGHNIAIQRAKLLSPKYHIVVNPDIYYEPINLKKIIDFLEINKGVGLLMPKILNVDGSYQPVARELPTPFNVFSRALLPEWEWIRKKNSDYLMTNSNNNKIRRIGFASGCFMVFRMDVLEEIGGFDERYFLYFEDVDISRRVAHNYHIIYYPEVIVYHKWARGTKKNIKLKWVGFQSAIKYFNKWGWLKGSRN